MAYNASPPDTSCGFIATRREREGNDKQENPRTHCSNGPRDVSRRPGRMRRLGIFRREQRGIGIFRQRGSRFRERIGLQRIGSC